MPANKQRPYERETVDSHEGAFDITPHNTNELTHLTKAIYVGGAGDLRVTTYNGEAVTFVGVPAGATIRIRAKKVLTATTATALLGLY